MKQPVMVESFLRRLGTEQARRMLRIAMREQSAVLLESGHDLASTDHAGHLLGGDDESITILLNRRLDPGCGPKEAGGELDCRLFLGEETYLFTSRIVEMDRSGPSSAIRIAFPKAVFAEARRRFQRARFAESSSVVITWNGGASLSAVHGRLCNVGADGIAVLVTREAAGQLSKDQSLTMSFELPGCATALTLPAVVLGQTPAGTQDRVIVRAQFVRGRTSDADEHLNMLSRYLGDHFSRGKRREKTEYDSNQFSS